LEEITQSHTEPQPEAKIGVEDCALTGPWLLPGDPKPAGECSMCREVLAKKWFQEATGSQCR